MPRATPAASVAFTVVPRLPVLPVAPTRSPPNGFPSPNTFSTVVHAGLSDELNPSPPVSRMLHHILHRILNRMLLRMGWQRGRILLSSGMS